MRGTEQEEREGRCPVSHSSSRRRGRGDVLCPTAAAGGRNRLHHPAGEREEKDSEQQKKIWFPLHCETKPRDGVEQGRKELGSNLAPR